MSAYGWLIAGVIAAGLLPGVYFAIGYARSVTRLWSWAAVDAAGWVYATVLLYVLGAVSMVIRPEQKQTAGQHLTGLVLGIMLDTMLWVRAIRWRQIIRALHKIDRTRSTRRSDHAER